MRQTLVPSGCRLFPFPIWSISKHNGLLCLPDGEKGAFCRRCQQLNQVAQTRSRMQQSSWSRNWTRPASTALDCWSKDNSRFCNDTALVYCRCSQERRAGYAPANWFSVISHITTWTLVLYGRYCKPREMCRQASTMAGMRFVPCFLFRHGRFAGSQGGHSVGACLESPFEATEHSVLTDQYYVHWRPVTRGDEETITWFPAGVSKYVAGCNHLD